jgi:hypothetical protein
MLSGFNTNFRYRGVLFHVQTEDSGRENPHVISHLFHGGNIMASEKHDYTDLMASQAGTELDGAIRKLMENQHKSMLKDLSRGEHDPVIAQRMGPDVFRLADHPAERPAPPLISDEELRPASVSFLSTSTSGGGSRIETGSLVETPPAIDSLPAEEATVLASPPAEPGSRLSRVFGGRVDSEKPLDEVVLDYLVENARKRRRSGK